ncbi:MAG: type II secretion system F family protein, partial [Treponema sp.]|nr:type II secretion system F family protein [Treponema sp.]
MKMNVLLFTQTMHSLLRSSLPLQSALSVCSEILSGKGGRTFTGGILKAVNEGKKLADVLAGQKGTFSPLYVSLVSVGEESGTLADVFGHLASYIRDKKNLRQKIIQAMAYPALVLATAVAVIFVLMLL